MKYDHLIQSIEKSADEKIRDLKERNESECREIVEQIQIQGREYNKVILEETRKKVVIEKNREIYTAGEEAKMRRAGTQQEALAQVFREAGARLSEARNETSYETIFQALLSEVLEQLEGEEVILHVDPRDLELCRRLVAGMKKQCEITGDLHCSGGLNGTTKDGKVLIRNTIEDRLVRARDLMRPAVLSELYGE
jgi:V/A-type H+/Na+-transporting ATPase subunit E